MFGEPLEDRAANEFDQGGDLHMRGQSLTATKPEPAELRRLWSESSAQQPGRFTSDIARDIGVSEAELIASRVGHGAIRLEPSWNELLNALGGLGRVKTVTRNAHAVMEKDGVYPQFQSFHVHSMFVGEEIDLRITLGRWASVFAYQAPGRMESSVNRSVQFYGRDGGAVHKLFLKDEDSAQAFFDLIARFHAEDQSDSLEIIQSATREARETLIDAAAFLQEWSELQDTHHFFSLLHKYKLSRPRAMQMAEGRFTRKVSVRSPRLLMEGVSKAEISVMVFLGNPGCLQIHKGALKKIVDWKGWLNVMDPEVEIHLKEDAVASAWVVEKPTSDGRIRSLELFDAEGGDILSIFGVRKEGKRQEQAWQDALGALPGDGESA